MSKCKHLQKRMHYSQMLKLLVLILSMYCWRSVAAKFIIQGPPAPPWRQPSPISMPPATTPAPSPDQYYYGEWPYEYSPTSDLYGINHGFQATLIVIVVATTVSAIIIVSISTHCFLKRRRRRRRRQSPSPNSKHDVENFLLQHGSLAPKRYKFGELKKITRSFGDKLGEGGYGRVYKGKLGDGRPVAVKLLAKVDSSSTGEDFMNEVASISRTSHVNVVTLLGFCSEGRNRALVYEFMSNGSLDKFLTQSTAAAGAVDFQKIAVGIAKGLEYLHTGCTTRIVHFDIKPQNILLDEDFCPKISDFGLAKLCKKKQSIIITELGPRGTIGYIAPEVFIRSIGGVSHKSDVYSYGMMLLKMAQAHKVVEYEAAEDEVIQSSEDYFPDNIYDEVIRDVGCSEMIQDEERETTTKMCVVGFWCIQTDPSSRPSISKVVEMLEGNLKSLPIPRKPMLCSSQPLPTSTLSENSSQYD